MFSHRTCLKGHIRWRLPCRLAWRYCLVLLVALHPIPQLSAADQADNTGNDLLVVDCLLPGQIRKLGRRTTYVSARRAIKTTARDCRIRGGEYVAYDRANYRSALKVWLPLAQDGDAEAALYVGEIYERGVGGAADYATAAQWYRRAAEAGDVRAQISLAYLYERGLGVPQDPARAIEWYRRASGLNDIQLDTATLTRDVLAENPDPAEMTALREEVGRVQGESEALREELSATRALLDETRSALQLSVQREADVREQAERSTQAEAGAATARREAEAGQLAMREVLRRREDEIAALTDVLAATRAELNSAVAELDEKDAQLREQGLQTEQSAAARRDELAGLAADLERREAELTTQQAEVVRLRDQIERLEAETSEQARQVAEAEARQAAQERLLAGPEIALVEPQLQVSRGVQVVASAQVAVVAAGIDTRSVIGRVTAPAGLLTLTVNDRAAPVNEMGVFNATIELAGDRTPVSIVAVDQQGKRADLFFDLVAPATATAESRAEEAEATARVPDVDFGNYHALIIGNNRYQSLPSLNTAIADAEDLDRMLREKYGFRTTLLIDATRYQILSALNELRERLTSEDNLLLYYAGHGELDEVNMRGHWLPVDAEIGSTANWLSNVAITDILNVIAAKQILVIADSCYSGSLTRSAVGRMRTGMTVEERLNWLRTMLDKRARMVFTSGGLQPVLDAGGGRHSVFSQALLDTLANNEELIEGQRLYQQVAARVAYAAASVQFDQVPEYAPLRFAGHETGDFFFVPAR